jgi:pimeloyl-ACP methyl ester carboxylesterase
LLLKTVRTPVLEIAYQEHGPAGGTPVVLLHGFPDDVHAYAEVAPALAAHGLRVLVPWLRGYGPTRFLDPAKPRSGEQAALGADLRDFMAALALGPAVLAGYDWGGRAACVVSALWPERVRGLVSGGGYNIQNLASAGRPASAQQELAYWYQWYFHTPRGEAGLAANRREIGRLLWRLWSPNWRFSEALLARVAAAWDNPDYVAVVIHSYRHRHNAAPGDPALAGVEAALARQPRIAVPTINLEGAADGVGPPPYPDPDPPFFTGGYERRVLDRVGHFLPHEAPEAVVQAVLELTGR